MQRAHLAQVSQEGQRDHGSKTLPSSVTQGTEKPHAVSGELHLSVVQKYWDQR